MAYKINVLDWGGNGIRFHIGVVISSYWDPRWIDCESATSEDFDRHVKELKNKTVPIENKIYRYYGRVLKLQKKLG